MFNMTTLTLLSSDIKLELGFNCRLLVYTVPLTEVVKSSSNYTDLVCSMDYNDIEMQELVYYVLLKRGYSNNITCK